MSCQHAEECPGCPMMAASPSEQRAAKRAQVLAAFARFAELRDCMVEDIPEPKPLIGYRTRAKLMVGGRTAGGKPRLGLYREGTHDVVDIPSCVVLTEALASTAAALRSLLGEPPVEAGFVLVPSQDGGALEAFDLREVRDKKEARVMLTAVVDPARNPEEQLLQAAIAAIRQACPLVASIAINWRGPGPQVLGPRTAVMWGPSELPDRIDERSPFAIATHGSFVQAHRGTAAVIHDEIVRALHQREREGGRQKVLELFAGSGALALRLAASGSRVHAIEVFAPAIELARRAADLQQIDGLTTERADAAAALMQLGRTARYDAVIVDPPRRGLSADLRVGIARLEPSCIVYVSCDPETLARDVAHFARLGYGARRIAPFDLMPMTAHVETLVILERAQIWTPRILYEDETAVIIDKAPHASAHSVASLVPVLALEAETSGIVVLARDARDVPSIRAALANAKVTDTALVRGITHRRGGLRMRRGRGPGSEIRFVRRAIWGGHSLVSFTPSLTDSHQARRQFRSIGHDVLGDPQYGHTPSNRHFFERAALDRPFLHRERLEWLPPNATASVVLEAPLADDLVLVRDRMAARSG